MTPTDVPPRSFGAMRLTVPDAFFAPLPEDELAAWEGVRPTHDTRPLLTW